MTIAGILGCASTQNVRHRDYFAPTPLGCVEALIRAEGSRFPTVVWQPCCGDGALSRPMRRAGVTVIESDLVDRGAGQSRIDFLMEQKAWANAIVSNPPFKLACEFIEHGFKLNVSYIAFLLKGDFLNSEASRQLCNAHRPARVYALAWRPDFTGEGRPTMTCSWYIFTNLAPSRTTLEILPRPKS